MTSISCGGCGGTIYDSCDGTDDSRFWARSRMKLSTVSRGARQAVVGPFESRHWCRGSVQLAETLFVNSSVYQIVHDSCDRDNEIRAGQNCLDVDFGNRFDLKEVSNFSPLYCSTTTGAADFGQCVFNDAERRRFQALVGVEVTRLERVPECLFDRLDYIRL